MRLAEALRQSVPIEVLLSAAALAVAEKRIPIGKVRKGDFLRFAGRRRATGRFLREGGKSVNGCV
ncbi:hypothetical protein N182_35975 [Sinorhizobium sp. GL2]|nr:hypothetical protein N182_35975 [Sinorhizobium sp. GL2]